MKNVIDFDDVIDRAKKAFKINADNKLAEFIGMKPNAFYNRKKAQSLPYDELLRAAKAENLSFDWLLTGEGSMYKNAAQARNEIDRKVLEMYQTLEQDEKTAFSTLLKIRNQGVIQGKRVG